MYLSRILLKFHNFDFVFFFKSTVNRVICRCFLNNCQNSQQCIKKISNCLIFMCFTHVNHTSLKQNVLHDFKCAFALILLMTATTMCRSIYLSKAPDTQKWTRLYKPSRLFITPFKPVRFESPLSVSILCLNILNSFQVVWCLKVMIMINNDRRW